MVPGADPKQVSFAIEGADSKRINEVGDLIVTTSAGEMVHHQPLVYQLKAGGEKDKVLAAYDRRKARHW